VAVSARAGRTGRPALTQRLLAQRLLRGLTGFAALLSFGIVFLILAGLFIYAYPAIRYNGIGFFTSIIWDIGNQYGSGALVSHGGYTAEPGASFGCVVFVVGTVLTSGLAMLVAVPFSILVALAIVYRIPAGTKPLANAVVELMAGIPSVVYGLWGMIVLVPYIGRISGTGSGNGLLAATIILAIMVVPIMVATTRDAISAQSKEIYEASAALGSTSWQAVTRAVLPSVRGGIGASVLLAFGRALGETMAVLMVCGSAINSLPHNIFSPVNTVAAVIVSQLESALTDASGMAQHSLGELALTLFVITLLVNGVARVILRGAPHAGAIG
jgi:phosphate transport system permease protein